MNDLTKTRIEQLNGQEPLTKAAQTPEFDARKFLAERRIRIDKKPDYRTDDLTVKVDDEVYDIAGLGMLGLVSGQEKSRKSTLLTALVASAYTESRLLGFGLKLHGKNSYWIDTEQPEYYAWMTHKRVLNLSGATAERSTHFAFQLRDSSIEERIACIDSIVENDKNVGLIVVDGALDLVHNMNDIDECQGIAQKFLEWTKRSGALIITVIHENRGDRSNTIGHIGAFLSRKCDFNIQTVIGVDNKFTKVNPKRSRTKPFEPFEFTQDANGYPVLNFLKENAAELPGEMDESPERPTALNGYYPDRPDTDNEELPF